MNFHTDNTRRLTFAAAAIASLMLFSTAGCNGCASSSGPAPITTTSATNAPDDAAADGNLAPVSGQPTAVLGQSASYTPQQQTETYQQQQAAPIERSAAPSDQNYSYNAPDNDNGGQDNQAELYAQQPPPPLPEYQQPPAPEDDYLWTPGYWGYANSGYYWVPGVWCPPPYYGALWTPPYWGYYGGRYGFHHGYWGPHVGFYGGVDYGFGYIGIGFFGGYWRSNHFYYNRSVTNVNINVVHNVYNREVVYNNVHYGPNIVNRVSYNGGRGGINVAPRPQELAALHETHAPALREQVQVREQAAGNRAQFYNQNHGRPAEAAMARPATISHQIGQPPAAVRQEQQRSEQIQQHNLQPGHAATPIGARGPEPQRANEPQRGPETVRPNEPARNQPQQPARQPEQRPNQPQPSHTPPTRQEEQHAAPMQQHQAPENRPTPPVVRAQTPQTARPPQQQEPRPQPQQARPQPQQQARPEPQQPRPQPQQQARPEPQPRPQAAPHAEPHPAHEGRPPV